MIERLYELISGRPYWTVRSMAAEFGATPATEFADELAQLSNAELIGMGDVITARRVLRMRAARRAARRVPVSTSR